MMYVVNVQPHDVIAHDSHDYTYVIKDYEALEKLSKKGEIYFSSSMDFPREYTKDEKVLKLVYELRKQREAGKLRQYIAKLPKPRQAAGQESSEAAKVPDHVWQAIDVLLHPYGYSVVDGGNVREYYDGFVKLVNNRAYGLHKIIIKN